MGQLVLGQTVEHIALVLGRVRGPEQLVLPFRGLPDPGVMAGDHTVTAQFQSPLVQGAELQEPVAVDAGVGGMAPGVAPGEFFHHVFFEFFRVVEHVIGHMEPGGHAPGIFHVAEAAAGLGTAAGIRVVVQFHGAADAVVPCILHEFGGYGAVHSAAHGDQCFHDASFLL